MSNRAAKFVSALFAGLLAGANFTAVAENAAKPADSCLSGPQGAVPAGGHWYYRVDRATKRPCWYLGDEKDKTAAATPQDAAASTAAPAAVAAPATNPLPVPPQANASVPKSIADAHAELPAPQGRADQAAGVNVQPGNSSGAAAAATQNIPGAAAPDAAAPPSIVTSRWPDSTGVSPSDNLRPAAANPPSGTPANARPAPQPAASPIALAAADSTWQKQSGSTQMLLMVMAGALALAGITASLVFRFARARVQPEVWGERRAIWDSVDAGRPSRPSPSLFPDENVPRWRDPVSRDPRAPDDPERRVQEMLARLARGAAN